MIVLDLSKEEEKIIEEYAKLNNKSVSKVIKDIVFKQINKECEVSLKKKEVENTITLEKTRVINFNDVQNVEVSNKEDTSNIKIEDIPDDFNDLKKKDPVFFYELMNKKLDSCTQKEKRYLEMIVEKCDSFILNHKVYDKKIYSINEIRSICTDLFKKQDFIERVYLYGDYVGVDAKETSSINLLVIFDDETYAGVKYFALLDELYKFTHKPFEIMTDAKYIDKEILLIYKKVE